MFDYAFFGRKANNDTLAVLVFIILGITGGDTQVRWGASIAMRPRGHRETQAYHPGLFRTRVCVCGGGSRGSIIGPGLWGNMLACYGMDWGPD